MKKRKDLEINMFSISAIGSHNPYLKGPLKDWVRMRRQGSGGGVSVSGPWICIPGCASRSPYHMLAKPTSGPVSVLGKTRGCVGGAGWGSRLPVPGQSHGWPRSSAQATLRMWAVVGRCLLSEVSRSAGAGPLPSQPQSLS